MEDVEWSQSDDEQAISDDSSDVVRLSDMVLMYSSKKIGSHDNVFEGEIKSAADISRRCVIKFATLSEQNVNEARILTELGSHSHVIALITSGIYSDLFEEHFYLALDKCHDENLRQFYASRREAGIEFDVNQAMEYARQLVVGVCYLHDNRVVHLDLKPSNVLLSANLTLIKVADFGLSVQLERNQSKIFYKYQFGTNGYRPIESFGNSWVSFRTDIFSLGTLLFNLISNGRDIFGQDGHSYVDNVVNDVSDTSGLLVPNLATAEKLIKSMINPDRRKRPNIHQVADHPFWTGKEMDCNFDYFAEDESDDGLEPATHTLQSTSAGLRGKHINDFVRAARTMGFNREPAIMVFDRKSLSLSCLHPTSKKIVKMQSYKDVSGFFRAASLGEYIYVFKQDRSVYRLEYGDALASWEPVADIIDDHGFWPPTATSSSSIFLSTGAETEPNRLVSRFDPFDNKWNKLPEKRNATSLSTLLVTSEFLYCFGGTVSRLEYEETNAVERMTLSTMRWETVRSMLNARSQSSAVERNKKIYLVGGNGNYRLLLDSVEVFNEDINQWTELKPINIPRYFLSTFVIDGNLYVIGGGHEVGYDQPVEMYDFENDEWSIAMTLQGMELSYMTQL